MVLNNHIFNHSYNHTLTHKNSDEIDVGVLSIYAKKFSKISGFRTLKKFLKFIFAKKFFKSIWFSPLKNQIPVNLKNF